MKALTTFGLALLMLVWTGADAAVISSNAITDTNPGQYNPFTTGLVNNPYITASGIGRGSGIAANNGSNRYNAKGWTETPVLDANDYFTFTLDAQDGYELNFSSFQYTSQSSDTGPAVFAFRSSIDSFASQIDLFSEYGATIDLSADPYQHLTNPVEFRLYGFLATGTSGTYSVNDYTFHGSVVNAVPEPQTWALVGTGSLLIFLNLRRKRKKIKKAI